MTEKPPTWPSGRQASQPTSLLVAPQAAEVILAAAATPAWVWTAPRGAPVVPEVAMTTASPSSTGRPPLRW